MSVHRILVVALLLTVTGCPDDELLQYAPAADPAGAVGMEQPWLSRRGLYRDLVTRVPAADAIEYAPDYTLWSDGVDKRRWLRLPPGAQIDTSDMDHWKFPIGAQLIKEFGLNSKPLETRLVERVANTGDPKLDYFMGTFVWLPDLTDAVITPQGVSNVNGTLHDVPRQEHCLECHKGEPGAILGFSAVQLSKSGTLAALAQRGLLSIDPGRAFPIPGDEVQAPALGFLHANCGHCHAAEGEGAMMRMRFLPHEIGLPVSQLEMYVTTVGKALTDWTPHPPQFGVRIVPGDPENSAVIYRMGVRSGNGFIMDQMPPLATEQRNEAGIAAVRAWITSLAPPPPAAPQPPPPPASAPQAITLDAGSADGASATVSEDASAPAADDAGTPVIDAGTSSSEGAASADVEPAYAGPSRTDDAGSSSTDAAAMEGAVPTAD